MARQMTPIIRPLRDGSGTIYAFPSAVEDIGLNLDSTGNKISLSRFAVLNLPDADTSDTDVNVNHFNFTNIPGVANLLNNNTTLNMRQKIVVALQNYMMNFETTLVNQDDYDYSANATVSERAFWKFLKETGAIRWVPVKRETATLNGKTIYTEEEESEVTGYRRVVQSIGEIGGGNSVSGEFGMYNETYVNIPSTYGASQIFFEVKEDKNYRLGEVYTSNDKEYLSGRDSGMSKETYSLNSPAYDYLSYTKKHDAEGDITAFYKTIDSSGNTVYIPWYQINSPENNVEYSYFTEEEFDSTKDSSINYELGIYEGDVDNTAEPKRKFLRSRLDGVQIISDIDNIDNILDQINPEHPYISYDSINIDQNLIYKENYDFNTILLYYTIYDKDNNNELATNLFGIIFLNSPQIEKGDAALNTGDSLKFNLPVYNKKKSNGAGSSTYFGNGYSFKVNIRSLSIYDNTDAYVQDDTTGASLYTEDFNDVVYNLNKSVETLQKNSMILSSVFDSYTNLTKNVDSLSNTVQNLDKKIELLNLRKLTDIESDNISVKQDFSSIGNSVFGGYFKIEEDTDFDIPSLDVSALTASGIETETIVAEDVSTNSLFTSSLNADNASFVTLDITGNGESGEGEYSLFNVNQFNDWSSKILSEAKMIENFYLSKSNIEGYQSETEEIIKNTKVASYNNKQYEIVPTTFDTTNSEIINKYRDSLYLGTETGKSFINYINYVPIIVSVVQKLINRVESLEQK